MNKIMTASKIYKEDLNFIYFAPTKIIFGAGSIKEVPLEMENNGKRKAIVITDPYLYKNHGGVKRLVESLKDKYGGIFFDVPPESSLETVNKAYKFASALLDIDTIVSIGGGSVIDTGKALSILLKEGGSIEDHLGFQRLSRPQTFHIAIPTTAGTGSEVTKYAVLKDSMLKRKVIIGENYIIPNVAILDPELTLTLPKELTASTAIDALSHCIEALHSLQKEPIADALAYYGIELIWKNLYEVLRVPDSLLPRGNLQIAATLGGIAFDNAQVGLVHGIAHVIGARYNIPHGIANGVILPYVILFNSLEPSCGEVYKEIAVRLRLSNSQESYKKVSKKLAIALKEFIKGANLPTTLHELQIPKDHLDEISEEVLYDPSIVYNGRYAMERELVLEILKQAWGGG